MLWGISSKLKNYSSGGRAVTSGCSKLAAATRGSVVSYYRLRFRGFAGHGRAMAMPGRKRARPIGFTAMDDEDDEGAHHKSTHTHQPAPCADVLRLPI